MPRPFRLRRLAFAFVIATAFAACGDCDESSSSQAGVRDAGGVGADASNGSDAGQGDAGSAPVIPGLSSLRVEPPTVRLVDDGILPAEEASFQAIGTFDDGTEVDVTDRVAWSLEHPALGTLTGPDFASDGIGGRSQVIAAAGEARATAELEVVLQAHELAPETPAEVVDLFPADRSADVVDAARLRIAYPSHETMFPQNLERVTYQWIAEGGLDAFELRFTSDVADVRLYATGDAMLPPPHVWRWLALTHAGASLEFTVRGVSQDDPSEVVASPTITLYFSASEVLGALYYWSTGAQGVMKAHIASPTATKFYTDPQAEEQECVSCHTVSRDGRKLAVGYGGENLRVVSVPQRDVLIPATPEEPERKYGWGTFNPGSTRLLYSESGKLHLYDADTGAEIGPVPLPEGFGATHPDWSPDGRWIAVAYGEEELKNKGVSGTSLARIPVLGPDEFGEPEILVASADDDKDTLFFPSYSPDSSTILFVRGEDGSKDNETATIWAVGADGGEPIALTRLNERVSDQDGVIDIGNSMPTWAPSTQADEISFVAFSSLRPYGHLLDETDRDQLWGAAIDLHAPAGEDPSYAAFWMPFQSMEEGNHRAFWALDTEMECPSDVEICDDLDNDCDGIVDNDCCTPTSEVCDDGVDNDCDGAIDEGCGCEATEDCSNGVDDDCDGTIDSEDVDCLL